MEAFAATAERRGVSADELGDRVVPRLGFEPGKPRIIEAGAHRIEVTIVPDFKFRYRDLEKNKAIASLPKGLPKEISAEFKEPGGHAARGGQGAEAPAGEPDGPPAPMAGVTVAGAVPGPPGVVPPVRDEAGLGTV